MKQIDDNGNIIMMGPMQYFHMDKKFAYNGQVSVLKKYHFILLY